MFNWFDRESPRGGRNARLGVALTLTLFAIAAPAARADVTARGVATATYPSSSATSLTVGVPAAAQPGDTLLASVGFGSSGAKSQPTLTPPAGWSLVTRTNQTATGALAVYRHVLTAGETSFTFTTSTSVGGTVVVSAFTGVDASNPVDASAGKATGKGTSFNAPAITTSTSGDMLVASYFAYRNGGGSTTWSSPSGMTELADVSNATTERTSSVHDAVQTSSGNTGQKTAKTSLQQDWGLGILTALRPAPQAPQSTPPAISAVQAGALSATTATVTWTTDQASDSQVEYGTTTAYGSSTAVNTLAVTGHSQNVSGLAPDTLYHYRVRSRNGAGLLTVSDDATFRTTSSAAVPVIVDTDIFSDADDVGALATAFGLQLRGEANVIAVTVNTRTSRPAVATNSWRCVAAIDAFYGSASIPIGAAMPDNGTAVNDPDFTGPCARLAPASTPAPDTAVNVYRRALAAQPDGSVVIASVGYFGNLSALLNSPPDAISPLSGRDLVAQKVKTLVAMAGGYPSLSDETNLEGDPTSARNVAANWPTKIVWSGYEVGDAVHTGQTIPTAHPAASPVRVAYGAFVTPGNWIYSYDLTALYHAVRPGDSLLREVGPGTNVVSSTGGNTFTMGSGNQYYLALSSATSLDNAIEALLDTVPAAAPTADTTAPAISGVGVDGSTVSWTTDERATSQVEYGTTTAYGSSTTRDATLTTAHSQALAGLAAATLYHYRVRSTDAAGNTAVSPDATFTTAGSTSPPPPPAGPSDAFTTNTIDLTAWRPVPSGSTIAAANQELEITHPAGAWTKGTLVSTPYNQTGRAVQVQVRRAANDGQGGSTYGETAVFLRLDSSHYAYFFIGGGSLTAWVNQGSGEANLTPSWPRYSATAMQWLRFRESNGTLYFEYASGTDAPGTWTLLASTADPFALSSVTFELAAGTNVATTDIARFDNVATS